MRYLKKVIAKEAKEEILGKVKAGESVSSLSKAYGISDKTIYNWLRSKTTKNVSWMKHAKLKKENQQLKELVIDVFLDSIVSTGKPLIIHTDQGVEYTSADFNVLKINSKFKYP